MKVTIINIKENENITKCPECPCCNATYFTPEHSVYQCTLKEDCWNTVPKNRIDDECPLKGKKNSCVIWKEDEEEPKIIERK